MGEPMLSTLLAAITRLEAKFDVLIHALGSEEDDLDMPSLDLDGLPLGAERDGNQEL